MGIPINSEEDINIFGVRVDNIDVKALHRSIKHEIDGGCTSTILHVNVHGLNLAYENYWLREFFNAAKIVFCDGAGVILGANILGYKLQHRITYADWTWQLAAFAEREEYSMFLLGARPGIANKAAEKLICRNKKLNILGTHHGYFDMRVRSESNKRVIHIINEVNPNILIVGLGMPIQERWLMQNREKINSNVVLTGGAVFDYISGELPRAPGWMTDHSLEWLGRLLIEPKRLWKRYLIGNPKFFSRILLQKFGILKI
jgi:N-acetylglucosaminyldiphosphoundecaprenol N-acetyl-beta-D-mannosaminyltransferase